MKTKKIGFKVLFVFLVIGLLYSSIFAYAYFGHNNHIQALSKGEEHLSLEMEYATDDEIKNNLIQHFSDEEQTLIGINPLDVKNIADNNLNRIFRIETINNNSIMRDQPIQIAEHIYIVDVKMNDEKPPVIEGNDLTIAVNSEFNIDDLNLHAYDVVDGDLAYEIKDNSVDTSVAGEYKIVVYAVDANGLKSQKTFTVKVNDVQADEIQSNGNNYIESYNESQNSEVYATIPALDRDNLYVRGWKIVANDSRVSDDTIRSYMNELASLPGMYSTAQFNVVNIDLSLSYPYLGMAYSDGRLWLNGEAYYATTVLHEATHAYDYTMGFANDPNLVAIYNAEKNNIPAKFSGNMRDDTYEWVANIVVYYYYDPTTLKTYAPQSYDYVQNVIL